MSKNSCYESPYAVTGGIPSAGLKENPTVMGTDRNSGTWKPADMEALLPMMWVKENHNLR